MHIAYIISMVKGGVPGFTYREIEVLRAHGYEIALCPLTYKPGPYMPKPEWPVFRAGIVGVAAAQFARFFTQPMKYLSMLAVAVRMRTVREFALAMFFAGHIGEWGAEHIHCHFGDSKLYTGYYCSLWLNLPMTVTVHAYEIHRNPNPAMFKLAAGRCSRVVAQSEFNKNLVMRNFGVPEDKIAIIRAHGDMSGTGHVGTVQEVEKAILTYPLAPSRGGRGNRLAPLPVSGRGWGRGVSEHSHVASDRGAAEAYRSASIKILMVGEFREKKGHEILFSAVRKLGRQDITLWIVGEGPLDVPEMARRQGVADRTVFLGTMGRDLLNILYDACDIFVLPSRTAADGDMEGIPAVLMEAMSHAKPVISTRHAGIPELVEEVLVDENDVDGLAKAIARLADDPDLRVRLGVCNLDIVKKDFSDAAVLELGELMKKGE